MTWLLSSSFETNTPNPILPNTPIPIPTRTTILITTSPGRPMPHLLRYSTNLGVGISVFMDYPICTHFGLDPLLSQEHQLREGKVSPWGCNQCCSGLLASTCTSAPCSTNFLYLFRMEPRARIRVWWPFPALSIRTLFICKRGHRLF